LERCRNTAKEDKLVDPDKNDPESRLALVLFRNFLLLEKGDFARAAGIAPGQYTIYERGERPTPRRVLEKAAVAARFPVYLLDLLLWVIRSFRAVARGKSRAERAFAEGFFVELAALVRQAADVILAPAQAARPAGTARPVAEDRVAAAALWAHLAPCTASERRMLVEELAEYRTWALCERQTTPKWHWNSPSWRCSSQSLSQELLSFASDSRAMPGRMWAMAATSATTCRAPTRR
jgi:transcriptional regulator with XRE-family HTH domain